MSIQITTLSQYPGLAEQTNQLIEESLNYHAPHKFSTDFYPLTCPENFAHRYIILNDGQVLAHIGAKIKKFNFLRKSFECVLLGGICVKKEFRGQGLFHELMSKALEEYKDETSFFMLWSDKHAIYQKYDFYLSGKQFVFENITNKACEWEQVKLKHLSSKHLEDIKSLYQNKIASRYFCASRTNADWDELAQITSSDLYFKLEDDKVIDYFFINKGMDLSGIVHEWAFTKDEESKLAEVSQYGQVWSPRNFNLKENVKIDLQLSTLIKVNPFCQDLVELIKLMGANLEIQTYHYQLKNNFGSYSLNHQEFLEEIFGFGKYQIFPKPLEIFISGLDSI